MKCSSGGWPLTSPDAAFGWFEQHPEGLSGLFPLSTWTCTLDLLTILQHIHIYTHTDRYTQSWSQLHPAKICCILYVPPLIHTLSSCSSTCAPLTFEPIDPISGIWLFATHFSSHYKCYYESSDFWLPRNTKKYVFFIVFIILLFTFGIIYVYFY